MASEPEEAEHTIQPRATAEQYEICRSIYEAEQQRYSTLGVKANVFITLSGLLLGSVLFRFSDLITTLNLIHVRPAWELLVIISLLCSLGFALHALIVREYQPLQELRNIVAELSEGIENEAFFAKRIADMVIADENNSQNNDKAATSVDWCQKLMLFSVIIETIIVISGFVMMLRCRN